jgi:sugar lactone lactonase YvrE
MSVSSTQAISFIDGLSHDICSPFFDSDGNLHIIIGAGDIISITETGVTSRIHCTGGQPNGATYDADGSLYVADYGHGAILVVNKSGEQETVVSVYEDVPLKGPSSVVSSNGNIYFTDSGPLGETGLHSPIGNVFTIMNSPTGTILKPISLGNLANPSGIAVSNNDKFM